jgi:hypothetical protein
VSTRRGSVGAEVNDEHPAVKPMQASSNMRFIARFSVPFLAPIEFYARLDHLDNVSKKEIRDFLGWIGKPPHEKRPRSTYQARGFSYLPPRPHEGGQSFLSYSALWLRFWFPLLIWGDSSRGCQGSRKGLAALSPQTLFISRLARCRRQDLNLHSLDGN